MPISPVEAVDLSELRSTTQDSLVQESPVYGQQQQLSLSLQPQCQVKLEPDQKHIVSHLRHH